MNYLTQTILAQVPDSGAKAPAGIADKFNTLVGYAKWLGLAICVLAMIAAGVKIALDMSHGRGDGQAASGVIKVLLGVVVVSGAGTLVGFML